MSGERSHDQRDPTDRAPGDEGTNEHEFAGGLKGYVIGFLLAAGLTAASFLLPGAGLIWAPSLPAALAVFAIAQIGVHLVFFLHLTSGPDNTNNLLALAFGVLIVALVVLGSLWIIAHLSHQVMPMDEAMRRFR
ncbi:MAG: cytochrome o ubiquinol oxidase subunit IV [Proteobacteria bacterium SG_bin6]|nr:MAG: cytochrome o ubiquinol oxidase subunit IV [Proteobacteria bacterium SG_bin6]